MMRVTEVMAGPHVLPPVPRRRVRKNTFTSSSLCWSALQRKSVFKFQNNSRRPKSMFVATDMWHDQSNIRTCIQKKYIYIYIYICWCVLFPISVCLKLTRPISQANQSLLEAAGWTGTPSYSFWIDCFPPRRPRFVSGMLSRRAGPFFLAVPCRGVM